MNDPRNKPTKFFAALPLACGLVAITLLAACQGNSQASTPSGPPTLNDLEAKLEPDAIMPMTRAEFPKMHARLGSSGFRKANDLTRWAAISAAAHEACDKVTLVGVSETSKPDGIAWYADCANGERVTVSEQDAGSMRKLYSKS